MSLVVFIPFRNTIMRCQKILQGSNSDACSQQTCGPNYTFTYLIFTISFRLTAALVFVPISFGNINDPNSWLPILSCVCLVGYSVSAYVSFIVSPTPRAQEIVDSFVLYKPLMTMNLAISVLMFVCMISYPIAVFLNGRTNPDGDKKRCLSWLSSLETRPYTFGVPNFKLISDKKSAATFKIDRLINNALKLHKKSDDDSKYTLTESEVMREYILRGTTYEKDAASFLWTWKNIWSRSLFMQEGIWFHSRLLVGQVTMSLVTVLLLSYLIYITSSMVDSVEGWRADLVEDEESDIDAVKFASRVIPKKSDIVISSTVGIIASMAVAITLILLQIPSCVSTLLKYRTGVMQTLHDPSFTAKYRNNAGMYRISIIFSVVK